MLEAKTLTFTDFVAWWI